MAETRLTRPRAEDLRPRFDCDHQEYRDAGERRGYGLRDRTLAVWRYRLGHRQSFSLG